MRLISTIVAAGTGGNWYESGRPGNIVIRDNTFQDCPYGGSKGACISFRPYGDVPLHRNIANNSYSGKAREMLQNDETSEDIQYQS